MSADQDLTLGVVRGETVPNYGEGQESKLQINNRGDQLIAASLPPLTETVQMNNTWSMMIPTGSAYTNVAGMPTTRAELVLYNGNATNTFSFVIHEISFLSLSSIAAASGVSLIWQIGTPAAPTDDALVLINSASGQTYVGNGERDLAVTSMVANKWTVCAAAQAGAAASIGLGVVAKIDGGIVLHPGDTLGVNSVAGTAVGTSLMGIVWSEVKLTNS